jgi:SAM-dependent methyltransferase
MYANPQQRVDCSFFTGQHEAYDPENDDHRLYYQKQLTQLPDNEVVLRRLNELFPRRGKVLEIGSYLGIFLERVRKDGWDVTGLEPYPAVAEYSRSHYGLRVVDGTLPNSAFPDASFDAVIMLHVIEHMPDPARDVREIRRILKPDGVLVVETPRFDSLLFKLLGRRERSVQNCAGHIFFFTGRTLRQLLERNGFQIFRASCVGRTLTLERFLFNLGLVARSARVQNAQSRLSRMLHLEKVRVHVNVRDMQRVYARAAAPASNAGRAALECAA